MSNIAFYLPAALQLVMPTDAAVSWCAPSADVLRDGQEALGTLNTGRNASLIFFGQPLTLEQTLLANEADREPESDETDFLNAAGVYVMQCDCRNRGVVA
ncbi:hypothetical protein MNV84_06197 [Leishmania braziliensis]|nr:hypothetical protein MNV84_06197 [Leishmania braziliensis]